MTDANKTFTGVLLLLEPCSNHAQLMHALSRHMDTAAMAEVTLTLTLTP